MDILLIILLALLLLKVWDAAVFHIANYLEGKVERGSTAFRLVGLLWWLA